MTTPSEPMDLGRWFPSVQRAPDIAAWTALAERALKGRSLERLTRSIASGVQLAPIAHGVATEHAPLGRSGSWQSRQEIRIAHVDAAVIAASEAAAGGVDALWLRGSLAASSSDDLRRIVAAAGSAAIVLDAIHTPSRTLDRLLEALEHPPEELRVSVLCDPLAGLASWGAMRAGVFAELGAAVERVAAQAPGVRVVGLSGLPVAEAGGDAVEELAFVLASLAETSRRLELEGVGLAAWLPHAEVRLSLGRDLLTDVAKLRALRRVWGKLLAAAGQAHAPLFLHARMADGVLTRRDPWTNLLRATQAGFAGAVGGADAITLLPHDHALGESTPQSRRIVRNLHVLLREESSLDRVDDPAAGSATIEGLTDALARAAWARLQAHESAGGLVAVLQGGDLRRTIRERVAMVDGRIRARRDVIVGVSRYPEPSPVDLPEAPPVPRVSEATAGPDDTRAEPLPAYRPSALWEELAAAVAGGGHSVFLAKLGPVASHSARAGFARELFAAGGFAVHADDGHEDPDAAAIAFATRPSRVACICGTDDDYERLAPTLARQLKASGARAVLVAGRWPADPEPWREAGITDVVHMGADVYAALSRVASLLDVEVTR